MSLRRSTEDRVIAGVCGGIAKAIDLPSKTVRIAFALFVLFGGLSIITYAIAWLFIPIEE